MLVSLCAGSDDDGSVGSHAAGESLDLLDDVLFDRATRKEGESSAVQLWTKAATRRRKKMMTRMTKRRAARKSLPT